MGDRISLTTLFAPDVATAVQRLVAVGATPVAGLTMTTAVPAYGTVVRCFGLVRELPAAGPVRATFDEVLAHPTNAAAVARFRAAGLAHLPANRFVVEALSSRLDGGVHLPLAFRPLNADLAAATEDWAEGTRPSFQLFFSQNFDPVEGGIALRRVFSLPVFGSAEGTLHDPAIVESLDPAVGILLESCALA